MIVAAAVVDDMIALVVLSQLEGLVGTITVSGILIPIVSALLFLVVGGYVAVFILPIFINKYILPRFNDQSRDKIEMSIMFGLVLALMPATKYAKASYLMGSFLAGLTFCRSDGLHHQFVRQFKRILQWLMRIFFSSTIGFQVPIKDFGDFKIIWQGLVFCLAWLVGKVIVGFMVPNFSQNKNFTGNHLRDCLVTGFSMAAEGEFAFVIAVFAVDKGLIDKDLYASLVLAVLISTIVPPFALRFTISYYNKKGQEAVARAAEEEEQRDHSTSLSIKNGDEALVDGIKNRTEVFLVIQTQSESRWGLLIKLMSVLGNKGLDVIDHRAWSPRGINTTLVNEVYARIPIQVSASQTLEDALDSLIGDITKSIKDAIDQEDSRVKVQRWFPGVVEEVVEETNEKQHNDIRQRLLKEAASALERKAQIQISATKEKTYEEIMGISAEKRGNQEDESTELGINSFRQSVNGKDHLKGKPRRRFRNKTHSTPVVGGGLFGEVEARSGRDENSRIHRVSDFSRRKQEDLHFSLKTSGVPAEITIKGEVFQIRISQDTWRDLKNGMEGQTRDSRGVPISGIEITAQDDAPIVQRLQGFVRNTSLQRIQEEASEYSEESSVKNEQR